MRGNEAVPDTPVKCDPNTHMSVRAVTMPPYAHALVVKIPKTKNRQPASRTGAGHYMLFTPSRSNDLLDPYWWKLDPFQPKRTARAAPDAPFFVDSLGQATTRTQVQVGKRLEAARR